MPRKSAELSEADVRAVVRLLGTIIDSPGDRTAKRRTLMNGLAKLVKADGWLWTMTQLDPTDHTPVSLGVIHNGLSKKQLTAWLESSQKTDPPLPEHAPLAALSQSGKHFTRTRQQLVNDEAWYGNETVQDYRLAIGYDHFLYTIYPLGPGSISAIGLYRHRGKDPFTERDSKLAHIVTSEIPWLHASSLMKDEGAAVPKLSRRLRSVLVLLLEGLPRKEIADLLKIRPLTARDHITAIYRHFGVHSQVELMRRFTRGDGGDKTLGK